MSTSTLDLRTTTPATAAFLSRLLTEANLPVEVPQYQSQASQRIEELQAKRATAKLATEAQHRALSALGGRSLPGAYVREASRVIALLSAVEKVDMALGGYSIEQVFGGDTPEVDESLISALHGLIMTVRSEFMQRPSLRVQEMLAKQPSVEEITISAPSDDCPF